MGLYALHEYQRSIYASGGFHSQWFPRVREALPVETKCGTSSCLYSYRSYRGYNYDDSYTSHAHGWSSGPTSALTFYVLGLSVTSPQGRTWSFSPHLSGLSAAEGGFETPLGWFGAKWATSGAGLAIELNTPQTTTGFITLPDVTDVSVDGRQVQLQADGTFTLRGGKHSVVAR